MHLPWPCAQAFVAATLVVALPQAVHWGAAMAARTGWCPDAMQIASWTCLSMEYQCCRVGGAAGAETAASPPTRHRAQDYVDIKPEHPDHSALKAWVVVK